MTGQSTIGDMYQTHSTLRTPLDETRLWRYMDLSEFLCLLRENRLYFAKLEELSDKWEGAWPASFIMELEHSQEFKRLIEDGVGRKKALEYVGNARQDRQGGFVVNCWHQNEVESVAMWKLYTSGDDGVAVQTTVGRLKSCLAQEARDFFIVEVEYADHDGQETPLSSDVLVPLATKKKTFRHESEVRVILDRGSLTGLQLAAFVSGTTLQGEALAINAITLIEKIVVAPTYPPWAITSLRSHVQQKGIRVRVETSDLLNLPDPNRMYRSLLMSGPERPQRSAGDEGVDKVRGEKG